MTEEALAREYYLLKQQEAAITKRLEEIKPELTKTTGERIVGSFSIKVSSFTVERLDTEAAKQLLITNDLPVPMNPVPSVRLTVKPVVLA